MADSRPVGGRLVVRPRHKAEDHTQFLGGPRSLYQMRLAADANDCRGRETSVGRVPADHTKNLQIHGERQSHLKCASIGIFTWAKTRTSRESVHGTETNGYRSGQRKCHASGAQRLLKIDTQAA